MSYILDALKKSEQERALLNTQETLDDEAITPEVSHAEKPNVPVGVSERETNPHVVKFVYFILVVLVALILNTIFQGSEITTSSDSVQESFDAPPQALNTTSQSSVSPLPELTETIEPPEVDQKEEPPLVAKALEKSVKLDNESAEKLRVMKTGITIEPRKRLSGLVERDEVPALPIVAPSFEQPAVYIEEASAELVKGISTITISSHIYSTQSEHRSIVVNGQRLTEGDLVFFDSKNTGRSQARIEVQEITPQGMIIQVKGRLLVVSRSRGWK